MNYKEIKQINELLQKLESNLSNNVDNKEVESALNALNLANDYLDKYEGKDKVILHSLISNRNTLLYKYKNLLYGDSIAKTYNKLGDISQLIRIHDKVNRITNQIINKSNDNESIEDTILDLSNYAIAWLIERRLHNGKNNEGK